MFLHAAHLGLLSNMKVLAALLLLSLAAAAQDAFITADPARSNVQFTLGDVLHTVRGAFHVKSGSVKVNAADGKASGSIVVDVLSGSSGGGARDRRMHKDILQSSEYPEAVFTPDRVVGKLAADGESMLEIHGVLRIHGQDHELTLPAKVQVKSGVITATALMTMPYVSWGMKNPSTFLLKVSGKVDLAITLAGKISPK